MSSTRARTLECAGLGGRGTRERGRLFVCLGRRAERDSPCFAAPVRAAVKLDRAPRYLESDPHLGPHALGVQQDARTTQPAGFSLPAHQSLVQKVSTFWSPG